MNGVSWSWLASRFLPSIHTYISCRLVSFWRKISFQTDIPVNLSTYIYDVIYKTILLFLAKLQKHKLQANTRETCYVKFAYKNLVISKSSLNVCYFIYIYLIFLNFFSKILVSKFTIYLGCIFAFHNFVTKCLQTHFIHDIFYAPFE